MCTFCLTIKKLFLTWSPIEIFCYTVVQLMRQIPSGRNASHRLAMPVNDLSGRFSQEFSPCRNGAFLETGNHFWYPDDVTLGYIIGESALASRKRLLLIPPSFSNRASTRTQVNCCARVSLAFGANGSSENRRVGRPNNAVLPLAEQGGQCAQPSRPVSQRRRPHQVSHIAKKGTARKYLSGERIAGIFREP